MFHPKTRILVVDDVTAMRKIVVKSCKELGFSDFTEASDGALAWDILQKANPPIQLIISDWSMPNMTGIELLKKVRADEKFNKIPFLMVTAEAEQHQVVEAIKAGVSNYVIKPFSSTSLSEKLEAVYKKISSGQAA